MKALLFVQPYCRIEAVVEHLAMTRPTASRYLNDLANMGILRKQQVWKETLFIHLSLSPNKEWRCFLGVAKPKGYTGQHYDYARFCRTAPIRPYLSKIHTLRGQRIMLDFELAVLYEIETKYLKRAVKHNISRFPPDFCFELNKEEWEHLRCNFSTSSWGGTPIPSFCLY